MKTSIMCQCDKLHDDWVVNQLGWFPSHCVVHHMHSRRIWGRPDLLQHTWMYPMCIHLSYIIMQYIVGWAWVSACAERCMISRMHMTVNRMWLSIATIVYDPYSTHTCTTWTQELSQVSSSIQQVHHIRPKRPLYTGPAHHDMVLAGYVQVAWKRVVLPSWYPL